MASATIKYPADFSFVEGGKRYTPKYVPGGGSSNTGAAFAPFSNLEGRSRTTEGFCATAAAKKIAAAQCTITSATSGLGGLPVKAYDAGIFDEKGGSPFNPCKILLLPTCPDSMSTRPEASVEEKTATAANSAVDATAQNKTNTMLLIGGAIVLGAVAVAIHQKWI